MWLVVHRIQIGCWQKRFDKKCTGVGMTSTLHKIEEIDVKMHPPADPLWVLGQYKPHCGLVAIRNLRRQGFHTFFPMHEETRRSNGKFSTNLTPLFPGYLFISTGNEKAAWRAINSTYGINRLIGFGNKPACVPSEVIDQLMLRCDDNGHFQPVDQLNKGDKVRVTMGPFSQLVATIEELTSDQRVWILLDLLGRCTRTAVNISQLQRV